MKDLIVNRLVYKIITVDKTEYGADIPFKPGLNIIWGPNSVGKSSIITGIVYGLGLEKSLGVFKSNQNPFKPEFYNIIDGKNIKTSYLFLEISNGEKTITIFRYLVGEKTHLAAIKNCTISNYEKTRSFKKYIIEGDGVFSENGFQKFIFDFLKLKIVEVPTYDNNNTKLYFENLAPLFFVEQRAGWSQIQARQITRYNIRDVRRVAFEYIMGFDKFDIHLIELEKKELEENIKKKKDLLHSKEENIFIIANAESVNGKLLVDDTENGKYPIVEYIKLLNQKYKNESSKIADLTSTKQESENEEVGLREKLKVIDFQYRKSQDKLKKLTQEIRGYEGYLDRIQANKYKNKQLIKIEEFSLSLNINSCPICEQPLEPGNEGECKLCHSEVKRKISTPSQNLDFLEDEEKSFKNVLRSKKLDFRKEQELSSGLLDKLKTTEKILEHQISTYSGIALNQYRDIIIKLDNLFKEISKYERVQNRWTELESLRNEIIDNETQREKLVERIQDYLESNNDSQILKAVLNNFKKNVQDLGLFKDKELLIDQIRIDLNDNYTPYLDHFDIYNISSSSDNVRIILSYYMSLLQTSIQLKDHTNIRFPNLLLLDEPKQQNLDNKSLISSIDLFEQSLINKRGQVILTTYSDSPKDKKRLQDYFCYEMKTDQDYLLKKQITNSTKH